MCQSEFGMMCHQINLLFIIYLYAEMTKIVWSRSNGILIVYRYESLEDSKSKQNTPLLLIFYLKTPHTTNQFIKHQKV